MAVEGAIPMTAATFKAAVQASKGTAATTKFICALATASGLGIDWDKTGDTPEHGCGTNDRPTRKKSIARRTSYMATHSEDDLDRILEAFRHVAARFPVLRRESVTE